MKTKIIGVRVSESEIEELREKFPKMSITQIVRTKVLGDREPECMTDEQIGLTTSEIISPFETTENLQAFVSVISKMVICPHCKVRSYPNAKCWWCGKTI